MLGILSSLQPISVSKYMTVKGKRKFKLYESDALRNIAVFHQCIYLSLGIIVINLYHYKENGFTEAFHSVLSTTSPSSESFFPTRSLQCTPFFWHCILNRI